VRFVILFALSACAPRLMPGFEIEGGDFTDSDVYSVVDDDGVDTTQVQAESQSKWVYYDFESNKEVGEGDAWDLAFQRFKIRMNGGAGGAGNVGVVVEKDVGFGDVVDVPADDAFEQDSPNPKGGEADFVFTRGDAWYYYDLGTHTLTSRHWIYVVRSFEGTYYKLQILNYYDSLGSSGYPAFKWVKLK
jgi:hypothetical protein